MNIKKTLIVIVLLFIMQAANAQNYLSSKEDLSNHSERIMKFLKDSKFENAFEELQRYWSLPENELVQLESQTIKQFNMVSERFGNIIGTDFIKDKAVKEHILRKIYVIKFEKHMIRVLFTYYNNGNGWILNGFKWDDQFEELFD